MNAISKGVTLLCITLLILIAQHDFRRSRVEEVLYPSPGLTQVKHLSDYVSSLMGTRGDSRILVYESGVPGGHVCILGGTHPNEPAGYIAADLLAENVCVTRGRMTILARANASAFTHTEPGEAHPSGFDIRTPNGPRRFRYGCRFTNPLDQWPDPEVYLHVPSGQRLSGNEARNLNRAYPGRANGSMTERTAFAITEYVRQNNVDLVIDLHEASLEYPVINAMVAHERAMDIAALANLTLQAQGLPFSLEPSPANLHGLSHRELGDATNVRAILLESANVMQGRLRGAATPEKILSGRDDEYLAAAKSNLLRVPYDSTGIPLDLRVGRHLAAVQALIDAMNALDAEHAVAVTGIPSFKDVQTNGVGAFLTPK